MTVDAVQPLLAGVVRASLPYEGSACQAQQKAAQTVPISYRLSFPPGKSNTRLGTTSSIT